MFKKFRNNKKAQNTAEYALLISLVVAAVIAMQTYAQRTIQARIRDASKYLVNQTSTLGQSNQYEPYYLTSDYTVERSDDTTERLGLNMVRMETNSIRTRKSGGFQQSEVKESINEI